MRRHRRARLPGSRGPATLIDLSRHPESPSRAIWRVAVSVERKGAKLFATYALYGTLASVRLPLRGARPLWRHTCCELFIGRPDSPSYREFNFSPSGDWAAYAFSRYREGEAMEIDNPQIAVRLSEDRLELDGWAAAGFGALRLGLAAVIEELDGRRSYWALRHAPGKPDFHHRDAFALELA